MSQQHLKRTTALSLAVAALAAPAAAAQQQDLRSPDARDAAAPTAQVRQDLRSPDSTDAAAGRGTFSAPEVTVIRLPQSAPSPSPGGMDWADAGIGAAGLLGVILVALSTLAVVRRRQGSPTRRQTATTG